MPTPDTKLLQGTLDMLILKALSLGPLHGYGVGRRIMQMSEDALRVEEGSLYPALYRIERQGWITAEWGVSENNLRAKFGGDPNILNQSIKLDDQPFTVIGVMPPNRGFRFQDAGRAHSRRPDRPQ